MKTFTAEEAQRQFSQILDLASQGEPVVIVQDSKTFSLWQMPFIPTAPPGYFAGCYDEEYIRESNEFAKHSVTTPPDDLE